LGKDLLVPRALESVRAACYRYNSNAPFKYLSPFGKLLKAVILFVTVGKDLLVPRVLYISGRLVITADAPLKSSNWNGGLYPKGAPIEKMYFAIRQAFQSSRLDC
jgi:hypothetical protein